MYMILGWSGYTIRQEWGSDAKQTSLPLSKLDLFSVWLQKSLFTGTSAGDDDKEGEGMGGDRFPSKSFKLRREIFRNIGIYRLYRGELEDVLSCTSQQYPLNLGEQHF